MNCQAARYKRHRFPAEINRHAVWLYQRFSLSDRDVEDILARRGIVVTHESIHLWCNTFGPRYAQRLRRAHRGHGDTRVHAAASNLFNLCRHRVNLAMHRQVVRSTLRSAAILTRDRKRELQ